MVDARNLHVRPGNHILRVNVSSENALRDEGVDPLLRSLLAVLVKQAHISFSGVANRLIFMVRKAVVALRKILARQRCKKLRNIEICAHKADRLLRFGIVKDAHQAHDALSRHLENTIAVLPDHISPVTVAQCGTPGIFRKAINIEDADILL